MKKVLSKIGWLLAVILAVAILVLLFTGIIQAAMRVLWPNLSETTLFGVSGTIGTGIAAIVLWIILRCNKHLGFYRCTNPVNAAWVVTYIIFTLALCRVVLPGVWAHVSSAAGAPAAEAGNAPDEPLWQMTLFGVVPPALEELLFRKDIFSLLLKRFPAAWTIGLTALVFAALHGYNAEGFVSCLVAGLLFAYLMYRTGSLWLCILAHMLCNLESLAYNLLEKNGSSLIVDLSGHTSYNIIVFSIGCIVAGVTLIYLLPKYKTAAVK